MSNLFCFKNWILIASLTLSMGILLPKLVAAEKIHPTRKVFFQNKTSLEIRLDVLSYTDCHGAKHNVNLYWTLPAGKFVRPDWTKVSGSPDLSAYRVDFKVITNEGVKLGYTQLNREETLTIIVTENMLPKSPETLAKEKKQQERDKRKPWIVLGMGILLLFGFVWQMKLMRADKKSNSMPKRLKIPFYFCGAILIGFLVYGIYAMSDSRNGTYTFEDFMKPMGRAVVFTIIFLLKAYFGPAFLAGTISYSLYCFAQFGHMESMPLVSGIFEWMFELTPEFMQTAYWVVVCLYSFGSSLHDAFESP